MLDFSYNLGRLLITLGIIGTVGNLLLVPTESRVIWAPAILLAAGLICMVFTYGLLRKQDPGG